MTVNVHLGDEQGLDRFRRYLRPVARLQLPDEPDLVHLAVYEWLPRFEAWATGPGICGRSTTQGPLLEGTPVTCDECEARRPEYESHFAALVPRQPDATPAAYDAATLAVLAAMEKAADEHLDRIIPDNTKRGYANDWALWEEFHDWLAERTGHRMPSTAVTRGNLVGFVVWLDTIKLAAPTSIDRRITGVTVTARDLGVEVPKVATVAARKALKPLKNDPERMARGRGKAAAVTPEQLRQMNAAVADGLAGLRDRALWLMAFGIAGRSAEVAELRAEAIVHVSQGLEVKVPAVKGRPPRDVVVSYGKNVDTCPVRAWLTWRAAAGITAGPAFLPITVWGQVGEHALSPEAVREIIARNAERAGVAVRLTGHSMRAGFITTSRRAGKREEKIREQSGHAQNSPAFWGYIREADKWTDAASEDIGL